MNWLTGRQATFEEALGVHPALQQKYLAFLSTLEDGDAVPTEVLALCRQRIEQIHGLVPDEPLDTTFEGAEVALALAEAMPYQHHQMPDEAVAAARQVFGDSGVVTLLTALAFLDVSCRLNLTVTGAN